MSTTLGNTTVNSSTVMQIQTTGANAITIDGSQNVNIVNNLTGTTAQFTGPISAQYVNNSTVSWSWSGGPSPSGTYVMNTGPCVVHQNMRRCVLETNGSVNYYLSSTNSTLKSDGTAANLTGADGMVMVEIPAFYYSRTKVGSTITWGVSSVPTPGYELHPAFIKNGQVVAARYISAYDACVNTGGSTYQSGLNYDVNVGSGQNWNTGTAKLASVSGIYPAVGITRAQARQMASNVGSGWAQPDFYLYSAIQLLYLTEFGTFYSQSAIGPGNTQSTGWPLNSGSQTDSPASVAGLSNSTGNGTTSVSSVYTPPGTPTSYMSYRGIENWFGNVWWWVDGINILGGQCYVVNGNYLSNYADDTATNYNTIGSPLPGSGAQEFTGWTVSNQSIDWAYIPATVGGSSTTYITDGCYTYNSQNTVLNVGGGAVYGVNAGGFYWNSNGLSSVRSRDGGARLAF